MRGILLGSVRNLSADGSRNSRIKESKGRAAEKTRGRAKGILLPYGPYHHL